MDMDTFQIPASLTIILAVISLIVLPMTAMGMSRKPVKAAAEDPDASSAAACDLPPALEVKSAAERNSDDGPPPLDNRAAGKYKTATFAMG